MSKKDLEIDIASLQEKINKIEEYNKIKNFKCNLKKFDAGLRLGAIFSLVPVVGTSVAISSGWNPFILNEIEKPAIVQTIVDSDGNAYEHCGYDLDKINSVYFYSKWSANSNGYYRDVYEYHVTDSDYVKIQQLINSGVSLNNKVISDTFNVVKYNVKHSTEFRSYVPFDEYKKKAYIEGIFSKIDSNDVLITTETIDEHFNCFCDFIIIEFLVMFFGCMYLSKKKFFDGIYRDLNANPDSIDCSFLKKQLEDKLKILTNIYIKEDYIKRNKKKGL